MRSLFRVVLAVALLVTMFSAVEAQVPNGGFESWGTATTPTSWVPNNSAFWTTVSRSTDKHSGTYAAQGQVVSYTGLTVPPTFISMIFPVSQRYKVFSGYYKFAPVGGDRMVGSVYMFKNSSIIGVGAGDSPTPYSSYTLVNLPIEYIDSTTVPDSAYIEILIGPDSASSTYHVGSTFLVDDLTLGGTTSVTELPGVPVQFHLAQNFPNPFNPTTRIEFSLPSESHVTLKVYNTLGEEVATLVDEQKSAGNYATDLNASHLTSGIYFYKLVAGTFTQTNKMLLLK